MEGQRIALAEQAEAKFRSLELRYADLIAKASQDQLRRWLKGILTAGSPAELFRA